MADGSKIEWSDATWQIITGCSVVSPGCTNCYAMRLAGTRLKHHYTRKGLTQETKAGPVWTGEVRFNEPLLDQPLRWRRPRMIFVVAHGDLFHENVPDEWIDKVFAVMALCPQHIFQVLTKRPERMREYLTGLGIDYDAKPIPGTEGMGPRDRIRTELVRMERYDGLDDWPLQNVWLGVSAEDQKRADKRIPTLLETPAAVRWVSAEPLLGPIDLFDWIGPFGPEGSLQQPPGLDWVVDGGESGPGVRRVPYDCFRSLRDQCAAAGVAYLHKQNGAYSERGVRVGKKAAGRLLDGVEHNEFPEIAR